jgi:hypothetical protein
VSAVMQDEAAAVRRRTRRSRCCWAITGRETACLDEMPRARRDDCDERAPGGGSLCVAEPVALLSCSLSPFIIQLECRPRSL